MIPLKNYNAGRKRRREAAPAAVYAVAARLRPANHAPTSYRGTLTIHSCSRYGESDVRTLRAGPYLAWKALRLLA